MMNVSSLSGLSSTTALSLLQASTVSSGSTSSTSSFGGASRAGAPPPPPPPPSGSGGAEAQSLFEALTANDDADGDGVLSQAEIDASPVADLLSSQFSSIDSDGDGLLTETELDAAESSRDASATGGAQGAMPPSGPPPSGPPPGSADEGTTAADSTTATTSAQSLYESLFAAMTSQSEESGTVTLDRSLANQFMSLLKEIA